MEQRVERIEKDVQDNRRDISDLKTRLAVAENNIQEIKTDLSSIKSNTAWIIRLILGAIILAVIGFLLSGGTKV
jgi:uncharacterized protein YeeX (DUF496 family)